MSKKKDNALLILGVALAALRFLIMRNSLKEVSVNGFVSAEQVVRAAWANRQTGREKIVNETLHWGVGRVHYIYLRDIENFIRERGNERAYEYAINPSNNLFACFKYKEGLLDFVRWLEKKDGYLFLTK